MYKKSIVLKAIRKELEKGNYLFDAWRAAGLRSEGTLHYWRKRGMIDRYIKALMHVSDKKQVDSVEKAHLKKMIEGKASASDYEFYLTRRAPERWPAKEATVVVNTIIQNNRYEKVKNEDLDGVLDGYIKRR
jgi:hypothetical protein